MSQPEPPTQHTSDAQTSRLALTSMILGFLGVPLLGSVLGHLALYRIKRSNGTLRGKKFSATGIFLGYLNVLLVVLLIFLVRYLLATWKLL